MKTAKAFARCLVGAIPILGFGASMLSQYPKIQAFGLLSFAVGGFVCAWVFIRVPIEPPEIPR